MHLGIERSGLSGIAQRRDGFGMASLLREGDSQIERSHRIVWAAVKHDAKHVLRLREVVLLQPSPPCSEGSVEIVRLRSTPPNRGGE
jgi:hypothetical protein